MRHLRIVHESEDLADHWDARERSEERALDERDQDHEHDIVYLPVCRICGATYYPEERP